MSHTWSHVKVAQNLSLEVALDRQSYRPRQSVRITIKISNHGQESYNLPSSLMNRSGQILFMERAGHGFFSLALKALFPRRRELIIKPGESIKTPITLRPEDITGRTAVLHYELPEHVRTFQVFLPLSDEETDGFRKMLSFNTEGVKVTDSWVKTG